VNAQAAALLAADKDAEGCLRAGEHRMTVWRSRVLAAWAAASQRARHYRAAVAGCRASFLDRARVASFVKWRRRVAVTWAGRLLAQRRRHRAEALAWRRWGHAQELLLLAQWAAAGWWRRFGERLLPRWRRWAAAVRGARVLRARCRDAAVTRSMRDWQSAALRSNSERAARLARACRRAALRGWARWAAVARSHRDRVAAWLRFTSLRALHRAFSSWASTAKDTATRAASLRARREFRLQAAPLAAWVQLLQENQQLAEIAREHHSELLLDTCVHAWRRHLADRAAEQAAVLSRWRVHWLGRRQALAFTALRQRTAAMQAQAWGVAALAAARRRRTLRWAAARWLDEYDVLAGGRALDRVRAAQLLAAWHRAAAHIAHRRRIVDRFLEYRGPGRMQPVIVAWAAEAQRTHKLRTRVVHALRRRVRRHLTWTLYRWRFWSRRAAGLRRGVVRRLRGRHDRLQQAVLQHWRWYPVVVLPVARFRLHHW
jgi:hypothetical protein